MAGANSPRSIWSSCHRITNGVGGIATLDARIEHAVTALDAIVVQGFESLNDANDGQASFLEMVEELFPTLRELGFAGELRLEARHLEPRQALDEGILKRIDSELPGAALRIDLGAAGWDASSLARLLTIEPTEIRLTLEKEPTSDAEIFERARDFGLNTETGELGWSRQAGRIWRSEVRRFAGHTTVQLQARSTSQNRSGESPGSGRHLLIHPQGEVHCTGRGAPPALLGDWRQSPLVEILHHSPLAEILRD